MSIFLAAVLGAAVSAHAAAPAPGDRVTAVLALGHAQIPLPEGEWTVAGLGSQPFSMPAIGNFGVITSAILARIEAHEIVALLEVNTNTLAVPDGWGRTKACADDQGKLARTLRYATGWETNCHVVSVTVAREAGPQAWRAARAWLGQAGLAIPELWLTATFRISNRNDLVDLRYHFAPSLSLGTAALDLAAPTAWSKAAVEADPARLATVQTIERWADGFDAWIERGLRRQLTGAEPLRMPVQALYAGAAPFVDAKLRDLDTLYHDGRIGWDDYLAQSRRALAEVPKVADQSSTLSNSVRKNISFRTIGTWVDYGIAYFVTANVNTSLGIALTLNGTDSVWFVLNDQYWDDYYARLGNHDAERIVDFTYIGEASP